MSRPIRRAFLAAAAAVATLATLGFTATNGAGAATSQAAEPERPLAGPGISTAAADAGQRLWTARYNHGGADDATSVAVSPDGTRVFVTGTSETQFGGSPQFTTVAYNAATGAELWASRYGGPE
jgi:hypothetical protein